MTEERQEFATGAARSKMKGRPDLIPKAAIEAMARRLELGTKYGENNWRLGGEEFLGVLAVVTERTDARP